MNKSNIIIKNKILFYVIVNILFVLLFAFLYWLETVIFNYIFWKYPNFMIKNKKYFFSSEKNSKHLKPDYKNLKNPSFSDIWHTDELDYWLWISLVTQSTVGYGGIVTKDGTKPFRHLSYIFRFLILIQCFSVISIPIIIAKINHNLFI